MSTLKNKPKTNLLDATSYGTLNPVGKPTVKPISKTNLLDSTSYNTVNPITRTTQGPNKNPRTGMTDTTVQPDPLQTARDAERNKFIATASQKEKLRLVNIELYDSVKAYNKSLGSLISETGLLKKAVTNIFGLDYIDYREEIHKMFPDANLQSSGLGSGPEGIPILTVQDLELLLAYYTNIRINGLSGNDQITIMMNKIEDNKNAVLFKLGKVEEVRNIFLNISATKELLKKIFAIVNDKMSGGVKGAGQWGVWNLSGKNITLADIYEVIKNRYPTVKGGDANIGITQICVLIINMLTNNINIVPPIDKESSENSFNQVSEALEIIFQGLVGTTATIPSNSNFWNIRDALIGFLNQTQSNSWTFTNPNRQEIKDPDIKKSGDVADQTYALIEQLGLTAEQNDTLINIITTLRLGMSSPSSETPEQKTARENKFANDAQIQFIEIINAISQRNPSPGFMTSVFNIINNNTSLLSDIYDLISNPSSVKTKAIVESILFTAGQTLTQYEQPPDTIGPDVSLGSIVDEDVSQELQYLKPIQYDRDIFVPFGHVYGEIIPTQEQPYIQTEPSPTVLNTLINKASTIFKEDIKKKNKKVTVKGKKSKDIEMTTRATDALSNITDFLNEENKQLDPLSSQDIEEVKEIIKENKDNKPLLTKIKKEFNTFKSKAGNIRLGMRYKVDTHYFETIEGAIGYINAREIAGDATPEQRYGLLRFDPPDDGGDDGGDGGGGPPGGGGHGRRFARPARRRRQVFNGLPKKKWLLLLIIIGLLSTGAITLDQIFKKDVKDNGTMVDPTPSQTPTKDTPTDTTGTTIPINPPKKDDTYFQIQKTDFWSSVGLDWIIDDYNSLVIKYNSLSLADKKNMDSTITKYYNKFAQIVNIPTLSELKMARENYEQLLAQYQNAVTNGLDFNTVNNIYLQLQKSITFLESMTDKYLALENDAGAPNLNKNDADITIDDVDANILQNTYLTTKLDTGKNKGLKDLLSKGMQDRITRKLAGKGSLGFVDQELQLYNTFGLIKNEKKDGGLGNIYDNPLIRKNREYDIKRYLNCAPNPKPFVVPSYRTMYNKSMMDKPILHNVIQIDDTMNYDSGNKMINQKLYSENPPPSQFAKSRLFNPEYHLEKINNQPIVQNVNNDTIGRSGPYYGLPHSYNQYYQYGNIQQKYNEEFNNYPIQKPIKDIKKSRNLPNSFSLK